MTVPRTIRCALLIPMVAALVGCAAMTAGSHVEQAADFTRYQTFDWGPPDALPTGDPRLDGNIFFRDHVMGAVEKQLVLKGFRLLEGSSPHLRVHYHANVRQRIDVEATDRQYGYYAGDAEPRKVEFEQGTLVVDVIDARTNRLIWRGWAQDSVDVDNRDRLHRQVDEGVARMFERFPLVAPPPASPVR